MSIQSEHTDSTTSRYSNTSENVSDEDVNIAYNLFSAEQMRFYRGVNVKLNRSFEKRKKEHPDEWNHFVEVIKLCRKNSIDVKCYIKYCFLNRLVQHMKGRTLRDVQYLTHYQQLAAYERNRIDIEKNYKIYLSILKSIVRIRSIAKERGITVKKALLGVVGSDHLANYITTGLVSRYFLALVPNMATIVHELLKRNNNTEQDVISDLSNYLDKYKLPAASAMKMFWPMSLNKSIIDLCC